MFLSIPIFVTKVKKHNKLKDSLLNLLQNYPCNPKTTTWDQDGNLLLKTDYFIRQNLTKSSEYTEYVNLSNKYFLLFYKIVEDELHEIFEKKLGYKKFKMNHYWFQQYFRNGSHGWHTHTSCNFSCVYFLHVEKNESTQFMSNYDKSTFRFDVEEGSIITFPSYMVHRSAPIESESKTVIAFNVDVYYE